MLHIQIHAITYVLKVIPLQHYETSQTREQGLVGRNGKDPHSVKQSCTQMPLMVTLIIMSFALKKKNKLKSALLERRLLEGQIKIKKFVCNM